MRLTEVFRAFVAVVASFGADLCEKVITAVFDSIGEPKPGTERVVGGQTFVDRPVDLGQLATNLRDVLRAEGLTSDASDVIKAVNAEVGKRGDVWSRQCLALTLEDHLLTPLRKAAGDAPAPAAAKPAGKKGKAA